MYEGYKEIDIKMYLTYCKRMYILKLIIDKIELSIVHNLFFSRKRSQNVQKGVDAR